MAANEIRIGGAREHNLKNLSLAIPRDRLVVVTGLSGSGKSSLAFDTIYAEGQRKYVESLSAYARQFLDQMQKPEVDFIEGLSPTIAIEQRSAGGSMRSIIATIVEPSTPSARARRVWLKPGFLATMTSRPNQPGRMSSAPSVAAKCWNV